MIFLLLAGCLTSAPVLPDVGAEAAPALLRGELTGAELADVATCAECHAEQAAEWGGSAHAHASFDNPWYRASVEGFRADAGHDASRMCGGCHDPALVLDGAMDGEIDLHDARATAGVACLACHGAQAEVTGNASLRLAPAVLPGDVPTHVVAMQTEPDLCVSCHRGFLSEATGHDAQLFGMDDAGAWAGSAWAGSTASVLEAAVPERSCVACHMADGHRFPGGLTQLGGGDLLDDAATVHIAGWWEGGALAGEATGQQGSAVDVVVRNVGAGHDFPAGLKDTQDLRLVVEVTDAAGQVLRDDSWRLGSVVVDDNGQPEWAHRGQHFAAEIADATVPPRGARVVRFSLAHDLTPPLSVQAQLVHRRHVTPLVDLACASPGPGLDGCAPQPTRVIAQAQARGFADQVAHVLALSHDRTEQLGWATAALATLVPQSPLEQAQVHWLAARIAARQGRVETALQQVAAAESLIGVHPALARVRGDALARVWQWAAARKAYMAVAVGAPRDTQAWRDLALAEASVGNAEASLVAAQRGLAGRPRDPTLLRHQALALDGLGRGSDAATDAWLASRGPDAADQLAAECERTVPGCRVWRAPVPVIVLGGGG